MVHRLQQRHSLNAIGANPLIASLRYRCECANNEVLSISAAIDMNVSEEMFMWTMRQLWRDVWAEVQQHLTPPVKQEKGDADSAQP